MAYNSQFPLSTLLGDLTQYLPTWMKIRKDQNSVGAQFLNVFALEYEDVKDYLNELIDNSYIGTAHTDAVDIVWRAYCDNPIPNIVGINGTHEIILTGVETIPEFYRSISDVFILDIDKRVVYTKKGYEHLIIDGKEVAAQIHHIWNHFDEFGMLLGTPRLYGETNAEYKNRLLAVFRYPGNATRNGVIYGASRLLGLFKTVQWTDDSKPFFIVSAGISPSLVWIDGNQLDPDSCIYKKGIIKINKLSTASPGTAHKIQYIDGFQADQLWDEEMTRLLYNTDGTATSLLKYLASNIQKEVPIMWDEFLWDEGYWDVVGDKMEGINYIPNIWDADIEAWRGVKIDSKKNRINT